MPFDNATYRPRDMAKMDQVIRLLSEERLWCKQQLRSYDGARCVLGAMMAVDGMHLEQPILMAIKRATGREFCGRIEMFNDHPATDHQLVMQVLHSARDSLCGISPYVACAPAIVRASSLGDAELELV